LILNEKRLIHWGQQLAMAVLRSLKSPNHFLSVYALEQAIRKLYGGKGYWNHELDQGTNDSIQTQSVTLLAKMLWTSVFTFYRESMVYDYNAARGAIQRAILRMKSAKRSDIITKSLDSVFETVFESEKEVSSFDTRDLNEFTNREIVITLNRCRDLKWSLHLRKDQTHLQIVKPQRSLRKGFTGKV
jgi:hypothetical protein